MDDKSKVGKPDRDRVSATEEYEVQALVKKSGKTRQQVLDAIKSHGPMRSNIERALGL